MSAKRHLCLQSATASAKRHQKTSAKRHRCPESARCPLSATTKVRKAPLMSAKRPRRSVLLLLLLLLPPPPPPLPLLQQQQWRNSLLVLTVKEQSGISSVLKWSKPVNFARYTMFPSGINCYKPANGETVCMTTIPTITVDMSLDLLKRKVTSLQRKGQFWMFWVNRPHGTRSAIRDERHCTGTSNSNKNWVAFFWRLPYSFTIQHDGFCTIPTVHTKDPWPGRCVGNCVA